MQRGSDCFLNSGSLRIGPLFSSTYSECDRQVIQATRQLCAAYLPSVGLNDPAAIRAIYQQAASDLANGTAAWRLPASHALQDFFYEREVLNAIRLRHQGLDAGFQDQYIPTGPRGALNARAAMKASYGPRPEPIHSGPQQVHTPRGPSAPSMGGNGNLIRSCSRTAANQAARLGHGVDNIGVGRPDSGKWASFEGSEGQQSTSNGTGGPVYPKSLNEGQQSQGVDGRSPDSPPEHEESRERSCFNCGEASHEVTDCPDNSNGVSLGDEPVLPVPGNGQGRHDQREMRGGHRPQEVYPARVEKALCEPHPYFSAYRGNIGRGRGRVRSRRGYQG